MCGIAGWLSASTPPDAAIVTRMREQLVHRGPDGAGTWLAPAEPGERGGACLGHRRLAIVDLAAGAQPMVDGDLAVTFNGEIYNHDTLRAELAVPFRTRSDTEVLLHGYRRWGIGLLPRLNGMFAFAIYDHANRAALLARDRMGQKPLYYYLAGDQLIFASELKALLVHPLVEPRIDREAIALYLSHEYVPAPHSAIAGVKKLSAGDYLAWRDGKATVATFARPAFSPPATPRSAWPEELAEHLERSVARRLMADVPLGVFLSGGIDSSTIVAWLCQLRPAASVKTFAIGFEDASFDESAHARRVAQHFGTEHHEATLSADTMLAALPRVAAMLDEPFADASLLPTTLLSQETRAHVTVALGGDGGDELFCGYDTFRADGPAELYRRLPRPARRGIARIVEALPVDTANFSLDFVLKRFVRGAAQPPAERHLHWLSAALPGGPDDVLAPALRHDFGLEAITAVMRAAYADCPDPRRVQRLSHMYLRTYLAEDILTKVDRASMSVGLEARAPLLDPELVDFVTGLPPSAKLHRGLFTKHILKQVMKPHLPPGIAQRKKKGFGVPVGAWLNGPLRPEADRLLEPRRLEQAGLVDANVVTRLLREHRAGRADHKKVLWSVMMLEQWREHSGAALG